MSRRSDTAAERRAFLDGVHRELFGKGIDSLTPDSFAVVTQTMADTAVLSDREVMMHYGRTEELVAQGAIGIMGGPGGGDIPAEDEQAALQLLRKVLKRELDLRGLTPRPVGRIDGRLLNGTVRGRALVMAWKG